MNFLRLHDPLLSVLFENEEIVAVDKPYGIDTHTNDSKVGNDDLVRPGLIELLEKQLKSPLHIVHRLDRTTTGVIVFAKSLASAKIYQGYFRNREAKKTYLFITDRRSPLSELICDKAILHKGDELDAKTEFKRVNRSSKHELWQANPLTGRNHQIRIHAAQVGIPILGDPKYGGTEFPFLCLHDQRISFPNGLVLEAEPPKYFNELSLLENKSLASALFEIDRRLRLFAGCLDSDQCLRLINRRSGTQDRGFTLDQFGKFHYLSWYKNAWLDSDREGFSRLSGVTKKPILVRLPSARQQGASKRPEQLMLTAKGEAFEIPSEAGVWIAREGDVKHELRADSGQAPGLFLDVRLVRKWVLENSKDKSVLNLFSQTCGFSVAAALGGATDVISVDTGKNALNWGRRNFELNDLDPNRSKFFCRESAAFLEQCLSKGTKFDLIICSPPSFLRLEKGGIFKIETELEPLLKSCLSCLKEGGELIFSTNSENLFIDDIRKVALKTQAALGLRNLEINSVSSSLDFDLPDERASVKAFLFRKSK